MPTNYCTLKLGYFKVILRTIHYFNAINFIDIKLFEF